MILILAFLSLFGAQASITGSDDRHEVIDSPLEIQEISNSIAALIRKKNLIDLGDGTVKLIGTSFVDTLNFCPDARFVDTQDLVANCSASLIEEDLLLTAGHCVELNGELNLDEFVAVFGYKIEQHGQSDFVIPQKDIYQLKSAPFFNFNFPGDIDVATIKLDRKVSKRKPLKLSKQRVDFGQEIYMLGFPLGVPMKYTDNGFVIKGKGLLPNSHHTFQSHLDSFSVNSGSAVFSKDKNEIVGILVRGTGLNSEKDPERGCNDWGGLVNEKDFVSEINYIDLIF